MTASDSIQPPLPVAALNVRKLSAQSSTTHGHAAARKVANLSEPSQQHEEPQIHRRRKRDVFFALFKPSPKHANDETKVAAATAVPVQIPSAYTNPAHRGCLVSGKRVAYSRFMHQGRRASLAKTLECAIPEDDPLLAFPATAAQQEEARAKAALETSQSQHVAVRSVFF